MNCSRPKTILHLCDAEIYKTLLDKTHHRPLAQQIVELLEGVGQETSNIERRRLLAAINRREINPQARQLDPVALIREERDLGNMQTPQGGVSLLTYSIPS